MEDHHVDRPGVEVRQRMKLTGTNRSIGLIAGPRYAGLAVAYSGKHAPSPTSWGLRLGQEDFARLFDLVVIARTYLRELERADCSLFRQN